MLTDSGSDTRLLFWLHSRQWVLGLASLQLGFGVGVLRLSVGLGGFELTRMLQLFRIYNFVVWSLLLRTRTYKEQPDPEAKEVLLLRVSSPEDARSSIPN